MDVLLIQDKMIEMSLFSQRELMENMSRYHDQCGGYGGYSNYYNYLMMAQMYANMNQTTYSTTQELDKDRFYRGILNGPTATAKDPNTGKARVPMFRVTFSIPKG